jgi:6-phosphogluconolactonase (cycloisomerase 2 family)
MRIYAHVLLLLFIFLFTGCGSGSSEDQSLLGNSFLSGQGSLNGDTSGLPGPNGIVGPGTGVPVIIGPGGGEPITGTLTAISLSSTTINLQVGATQTLIVTGQFGTEQSVTLPGNTNASVSYVVTDPAVASVSGSGLVTALAVGATQVVVTVVSDGATFTATAELVVTSAGGIPPIAFILVSNPTPNGSGGSVSSIAVAPDGSLTVVDDNPSVNRPLGIAATPSGDFGYAANFFSFGGMGTDISVFAVDLVTGLLTFNGPSVPTNQGGSQRVVVDPTGRFLYVTDATLQLAGFLIGNDGSLTPNPAAVTFDSGAGGFTSLPIFNLAGDRMFIPDTGDDSVVVLSVDTLDGALALFGPEIPAGPTPRNVTLSQDGNFLYVSNDGDEVRSFSGASSGNLGQIDFATVDPGPGPMAVHPTLPVLYVAGGSDTVQTIPLEPSGGLGLPGASLPTGNRPTTILIDESGSFAYVLCRGNSQVTEAAISAYSIDATTGQLTFLQDYEFSELSFPSAAVIVSSLAP